MGNDDYENQNENLNKRKIKNLITMLIKNNIYYLNKLLFIYK